MPWFVHYQLLELCRNRLYLRVPEESGCILMSLFTKNSWDLIFWLMTDFFTMPCFSFAKIESLIMLRFLEYWICTHKKTVRLFFFLSGLDYCINFTFILNKKALSVSFPLTTLRIKLFNVTCWKAIYLISGLANPMGFVISEVIRSSCNTRTSKPLVQRLVTTLIPLYETVDVLVPTYHLDVDK